MHALPPDLERLIDQALIQPDDEDGAFIDALVDAERHGDLTREQALTLIGILGQSRAQELARALVEVRP
jgi:hypothetical protein